MIAILTAPARSMKFVRWLFLLVSGVCLSKGSLAQRLLTRPVTIALHRQPISRVLEQVGQQGGFSFSYNAQLFNSDSLVSLRLQQQPVSYALEQLLGDRFMYKETGNYLIIQLNSHERYYSVSGIVLDAETGEKVELASIYDKSQMIVTSSNQEGYFRLRLKAQRSAPLFTVSRLGYADTTLVIPPAEQVTIRLKPKAVHLNEVVVNPYAKGENSWLANRLLSRRLRTQSQNLGEFFVNLPYQIALTPGLSSRGRLSTQVVNKVSINLLGGYNAGVNGVELAGVFNITKNNVRSLQVAGLFNLVGGQVRGVQLAGLHNNVLDTLAGVQVAGLTNVTQVSQRALQVAGLVNVARQSAHAMQIAGLSNHIRQGSSRFQIAGLFNSHSGEHTRIQIAGLYNYSKNLKGVQIGIVNQTDSTSGVSIGLVNLTRYGKRTLSLSANELVPLQLAFKSGNRYFYTVLLAGYSPIYESQAFTFGLGIGREFRLSERFDFAAEFSSQSLYQGSWKEMASLYRFQPIVRYKTRSPWVFIIGPTGSLYHSTQLIFPTSYLAQPGRRLPSADLGPSRAWLGGQVGLEFSW